MKRVRFWGTRGSLPVALTATELRARLITAVKGARDAALATEEAVESYVDGLGFPVAGTFGGHTSCVQIETGSPDYVLCDLGSGVRPFGQAAMARHGFASPQTYHVFMSHLHWDHIMGLPFFTPAYLPGNKVRIYGGHRELEAALRRQMEPPSFPVPFSYFKADIEFFHLAPGIRHEINGMTVTTLRQRHGGDSYGYRFEQDGRTVVYSTDSEHTLADAISVKADWGHSSNIIGVELCQLAGAGHLCLFHHEPAYDDATIARVLDDTLRLEEITRAGQALRISAAYDGLEIDL